MSTASKHQGSAATTISLSVPIEFNFNQCLKFLNRSPKECLHRVDGLRWEKLLDLNGQLVLIEVYFENGRLQVFTPDVLLSSDQKEQVVAYVEEVFDLHRDLKPFYESMKADKIMAPLVDSYYGLRLIGLPELFEALCWCIIGQQINLSFAYDLKRRLVEAKGERLDIGGRNYYLFPSPSVVASLTPESFVPWKYSASKAKYLIGVAQEICQGKLLKEELLQMSTTQAFDRLISIKGIGPWSAHYVLMKCLRYTSAFPMADVGLQNAIKMRLAIDRKPTIPELESLGKQWKPWEAYATFYLWHSLIK